MYCKAVSAVFVLELTGCLMKTKSLALFDVLYFSALTLLVACR